MTQEPHLPSDAPSPSSQDKPHRLTWRTRMFKWWRAQMRGVDIKRRGTVAAQLREGARPDFDYFLMVLLSSVIATLGLLINSGATVIGAMLVAPLMTPILGLGLASLNGDRVLLRDATSALLRGALVAIATALVLTLINRPLPFAPLQQLPHEVLARTRPGPIDLAIALAGGAAAAFAWALPAVSPSLPGVAIATALMPPLDVVGIGIGLGRWNVAGGAFLLFLTNAIAIAFASMVVFYILDFGETKVFQIHSLRDLPGVLRVSGMVVLLLSLPLAYLSARFVHQAAQTALIDRVAEEEVTRADAMLTGIAFDDRGGALHLELQVRTQHTLNYEEVRALQGRIAARLGQPVSIVVDQTLYTKLNPLIPPTPTPTATAGPSPTATATSTATATPTATATSTATPTASATPTATVTPTPTPSWGKVTNTHWRGVHLRQSPDGPIIATLPEGAPLRITYHLAVVGGLVWVEVYDAQGRLGWLPMIYAATLTPTPTMTPSPTPSPQPQPSATPSPTATP